MIYGDKNVLMFETMYTVFYSKDCGASPQHFQVCQKSLKLDFKISVTRVICEANNMSDHMWFVVFNKKLRLTTDLLHLPDSETA